MRQHRIAPEAFSNCEQFENHIDSFVAVMYLRRSSNRAFFKKHPKQGSHRVSRIVSLAVEVKALAQELTRALVADAHFLSSAGIAEILRHHLGVIDVECVGDFDAVWAALSPNSQLNIMTVDLDLPGMNGLKGISLLKARYPCLHIVVVSDHAEKNVVLRGLASGIHGYLLKDMPSAEMVDAFRLTLAGQIYVPSCVAEFSGEEEQLRPTVSGGSQLTLTMRQRDVVELLRKGYSNKEIGRALDISESTVKVHMAAAFRSLGVHNRVAALTALNGTDFAMSRQTTSSVSGDVPKRRASDFPVERPASVRPQWQKAFDSEWTGALNCSGA
jgi:DNA-binding NarL/FixJ family response regulator